MQGCCYSCHCYRAVAALQNLHSDHQRLRQAHRSRRVHHFGDAKLVGQGKGTRHQKICQYQIGLECLQLQLRTLIPDLCAAFERLLADPLKSDPKCWGKDAIAKALKDLGHDDSEIFLKGARHVQREPVWGGEEDTATGVRGSCALALLGCGDLTREDKLWPMMRLLTERSASLRKDGVFAEYFTMPLETLFEVPDNVTDEQAVFVEPLAAACEITEQLHIKPFQKVIILGDGKLGLITALALNAQNYDVTLVGKHKTSLILRMRKA